MCLSCKDKRPSVILVKEEPKQPETVSPSTYDYENQQDSAKTILRASSLSRHDVMSPPCKTSHTFRMQPLHISREDPQLESGRCPGSIMKCLKPGYQRKAKKTFPEHFKHERSKMSKKKKKKKKKDVKKAIVDIARAMIQRYHFANFFLQIQLHP